MRRLAVPLAAALLRELDRLSEDPRLLLLRRGEGDGEAARIYANALRQAPDFYEFLRAMEASRTFARKSTTMVLPADSPLFGVLFNSKYFDKDAPVGDGARLDPPEK